MSSISTSLLAAAVIIATTFTNPALHAGDADVLLTKIDEGDRKRTVFEAGGTWRYDRHQDEAFTLLRPETVPLTTSATAHPITITIDRTNTYQTILGHGGAMTDASAFVLMNLKAKNPELYAYTMTRLFSPTEGAGFSVLRLAMGASDYVATKAYFTYCDQESMTLDGFSIARDQEFIIPALKDALALNPDLRLIASPWSPPAWMKNNRSLLGVSAADKATGASNTLRSDCFAVYADYFVKFIEAYQAAGVTIHGVTLQNEPQFDGADYPCLRMNADDQIRFVRLLGPKLAERMLTTRIFVHDHNWVLHPNDLKTVGGDTKLQPLESVTKIMSDPEAAKYIAGSSWHCYSGGAGDMKRVYDTIHARFPERQILTTELSGWGRNRGNWWGDVEWGMTHNWLGTLQNWSEASLQWNLALDHQFGPTLRHDSQAMGIVTIRSDDWQNVRFEREFYAMAQVSRAARPGAKRIGTRITAGGGKGLEVIAFALADGTSANDKTSLVVFNKRGDEAAFQISDGTTLIAYRLPARSIVTFRW